MKKWMGLGGGVFLLAAAVLFAETPESGFRLSMDGGVLNVFAVEGFTNRVEIYSARSLVSNVWKIAARNLEPTGGRPAVWMPDCSLDHCFFRAGNMDLDSDGDGISDARERFIHKTDPDDPDSDGDTVSDGQELTVRRTDPTSGDASPPLVSIKAPRQEDRKVVLP